MIPWWLPEPWASWFSAATPATRAVESPRTAGVDTSARVTPASFGRDPYAADQHHGSDDLELWPPSAAERELACRWIDHDDADAISLGETCESIARVQAVLELIRRERWAARTLGRVAP